MTAEPTRSYAVIGDVHGCLSELQRLVALIRQTDGHDRRTLVFSGDLADRGPENAKTLAQVMVWHKAGQALCVMGNHDDKLRRGLMGNQISLTHGIVHTMTQVRACGDDFVAELRAWLDGLPWYLDLQVASETLDEQLLVVHAGLSRHWQLNRGHKNARAFALYGDVVQRKDPVTGLPVRADWASSYGGQRPVVHGHETVVEAEWRNNVIDVDTACVFGGKLTALLWPERTTLDVQSNFCFLDTLDNVTPSA
jgi:protein phosphatase